MKLSFSFKECYSIDEQSILRGTQTVLKNEQRNWIRKREEIEAEMLGSCHVSGHFSCTQERLKVTTAFFFVPSTFFLTSNYTEQKIVHLDVFFLSNDLFVLSLLLLPLNLSFLSKFCFDRPKWRLHIKTTVESSFVFPAISSSFIKELNLMGCES